MIYVMSGGTKLFAAIGVTYPEGSTCTCSNKLMAEMTKGQTGTTDGVFVNNDTHITTETFIPVVPNLDYYVNAPSVNPGDSAGEHGVVFFKADKSFLSYAKFTNNDTYVYFSAPANASYMKLNFYVKTQPETMYADISVMSDNTEKVLKPKNASGRWIVPIPFVGTWTVTVTDGTYSKSESVAISAEGQNEVMELSYGYYIFESGKGLAAGYTLKGYSYSSGSTNAWTPTGAPEHIYSQGGNRGWYINESINMSEYSALKARMLTKADGIALRVDDANPGKATFMKDPIAEAVLDSAQTGKEAVLSLDLSGITNRTALYIGWDMRNIENYVYDLWLE